MSSRTASRAGFTLVEVAVATTILVVALGLALGGLAYFMRGASQNDVQNDLDIDVQKAMERLKYDVRLSSLDKMFFYPEGAGPYTAISFPMARDDDGDGLVDLNEEGKILWDRTLIYHVWSGEPNQLRLTTFDPRDETLTDAQRQEQINSVAYYGNGTMTHNRSNAHTTVVFQNLFNWRITPRGSTYDAYAPALERDIGVNMGSVVLTPGTHTFKFTVTGKNAASSGYKIGVDTLTAAPSLNTREAEDKLPVVAQNGATAVKQYMAGGSWSGNYHLYFPATAVGHYFSISLANDRWEDTNFADGGTYDNVLTKFDFGLSPYDFVVTLDGYGYNWWAYEQTGDTNGIPSLSDAVRGAAVRVLMRGEDMLNGGWLRYDGAACWVSFRAGTGSGNRLKILKAWVGEAADQDEPTMNVQPGTQQQIQFSGADGITIDPGCSYWAGPLYNYNVKRDRSYLVTYLVDQPVGMGNAWKWRELIAPAMPGSYVIPGSRSPTAVEAQATNWSARADVVATNAVLGVQALFTYYPTNGTYVSPVIDTHQESPVYSRVEWSEQAPYETDLQIQVRTGGSNDLSDAADWSALPRFAAPGAINPGNHRYLQYRVDMQPNSGGYSAPKLQNIRVIWTGVERFVDVVGTFTKGPDYGIFELTVDGEKLTTGVNVDLEIFKDARGFRGSRRVTSALTAEVTPRNSGR